MGKSQSKSSHPKLPARDELFLSGNLLTLQFTSIFKVKIPPLRIERGSLPPAAGEATDESGSMAGGHDQPVEPYMPPINDDGELLMPIMDDMEYRQSFHMAAGGDQSLLANLNLDQPSQHLISFEQSQLVPLSQQSTRSEHEEFLDDDRSAILEGIELSQIDNHVSETPLLADETMESTVALNINAASSEKFSKNTLKAMQVLRQLYHSSSTPDKISFEHVTKGVIISLHSSCNCFVLSLMRTRVWV